MASYIKNMIWGSDKSKNGNASNDLGKNIWDGKEEGANGAGPSTSTTETAEKKGKADVDNKYLDLAFAMDCTSSMGSYIHEGQKNIRKIVEEIVSKEKADVRMALVEYRDHPPQDSSFVTRVHDFTNSVRSMKGWIDGCSAQGGGDCPEAVADALHQVLKLNWRPEAAKVCVFIADAPPHGLSNSSGDGFPNGCPCGLDPMQTTGQLAEKGVTLYMVGCEPSITPYHNFFMALAHTTGGQYVPLASARVLAKVIIGGAQEEISLQQLMEEVNQEVMAEAAAAQDGELEEEEVARKVHTRLMAKGARGHQLQLNCTSMPAATDSARMLAAQPCMADVKANFKESSYTSAHTDMLCEDAYGVVEDAPIQQEQATRMVRKAMWSSNVNHKFKKSS